MSQKKRPHQGDTERIEDQATGYEFVQDWDPASGVLRTCCNGHVPEFYPTQNRYGRRFVRKKDQDRVRYDNSYIFILEKTGTQLSGSHSISFVSGSNSKARKW